MKMLLKSLLFTCVLSLVGPVFAMEREADSLGSEACQIYFQNKTSGKIKILFTASTGDGSVTLDVGFTECILPNVSHLNNLEVEPYGRIRGKLSRSYLSVGLVKPKNVAELEAVQKAIEKDKTILIEVKDPEADSNGSFINYYVVPQDYSYKVHKLSVTLEESATTIFEQFPQVQKALDEDRPVLPRYVLSLPEEATEQETEDGYLRKKAYWQERLASDSLDEQKLAKKALMLVEEAYRALKKEDNLLQELIDVECKEVEVYTCLEEIAEPRKEITDYDSSDSEIDTPEHRDVLRDAGMKFFDEN